MRYFLMALVLAVGCRDATATGDRASVVIESATIAALASGERVTVRLRNQGGRGAFYIEFAGLSSVPNQSGPTVRSESVDVAAGYTEVVPYTVPFRNVRVLRVFSRAASSANYTRTDCYRVPDNVRC